MFRELEQQFGVFLDAGLNHGADAMVDQGMKVLFDADPGLYRAIARSVADHPKTVETALATAVQGFDWGMKAIYHLLPGPIRKLTSETDFGEDFLAKLPTAVVRHFQVNPLAEPAEAGSTDDLEKHVDTVAATLRNARTTILNRPREFAKKVLEGVTKKAKESGVSESQLSVFIQLREVSERLDAEIYEHGGSATREVMDSQRAGEPWGSSLRRDIEATLRELG